MADLPELTYGMVRGRFLAGVGDTDDPGLAPDVLPMSGFVTFTAARNSLLVPTATPAPVTLFPRPIVCMLDGDGYLTDALERRDVALLSTDNPLALPVGWTWRASFDIRFEGELVRYPEISFLLPGGVTVDLTTVAPAPPDPGQELPAWLAAVAAAGAARDAALAARVGAETARTGAETARDAAQAAAVAAQGLGILKVGEAIPANWPSKIVLREA